LLTVAEQEPPSSATELLPSPLSVATVFDRQALLDRLGNNEEALVRVMRVFVEATPADLVALQDLIVQGNTTEAWRVAHKIKGSAAICNCPTLNAMALAMEMAGKANDLTALRSGLPDLEKAFSQVLDLFADSM
jgi:HPt (histidine-containing phosphotransfer) domain-containing protein